MSVERHDLHHEFPEYGQHIHHLKETDHHFRKLFDQYHELDNEIHKVENQGVNVSDAHFESLKQKRVALKDALYDILRKAAA